MTDRKHQNWNRICEQIWNLLSPQAIFEQGYQIMLSAWVYSPKQNGFAEKKFWVYIDKTGEVLTTNATFRLSTPLSLKDNLYFSDTHCLNDHKENR